MIRIFAQEGVLMCSESNLGVLSGVCDVARKGTTAELD
jgi:hypothetical protein